MPPRDLRVWSSAVDGMVRALTKIGYLSIEVKNSENLPLGKRTVYVANHSGWIPLDGLFAYHQLYKAIPDHAEFPYGVWHDATFKAGPLSRLIRMSGGIPASWLRDPERLPPEVNIGLFPEGADGNCKPFWDAYQMKPWRSGFARIAILRQAMVSPTAIIGFEECLPTVWTAKWTKHLIGTVAPIGLMPFLLPGRIKIVVDDPVDFSVYPREAAFDRDALRDITEKLRARMQAKLLEEAADWPLLKARRKYREGLLSSLRKKP